MITIRTFSCWWRIFVLYHLNVLNFPPEFKRKLGFWGAGHFMPLLIHFIYNFHSQEVIFFTLPLCPKHAILLPLIPKTVLIISYFLKNAFASQNKYSIKDSQTWLCLVLGLKRGFQMALIEDPWRILIFFFLGHFCLASK